MTMNLFFYFTLILIVISGITGFIVYKKANNKLKEKAKEIDTLRKEYQKEEKEIIAEILQEVKDMDNQITEEYTELLEKNSVVFECPCNHNSIRTFIDLSKEENTFVCPECKNEYRVDIQMVPILKGKIVDEHNLYNLLSQKVRNV